MPQVTKFQTATPSRNRPCLRCHLHVTSSFVGDGDQREHRRPRRPRRRPRPLDAARGREGGLCRAACARSIRGPSTTAGAPHVALALRAGGPGRVRPGGGVHHDPGEVVDPDDQDQRDAEGLEGGLVLGAGQQVGRELLEQLEAERAEQRAGPQRPVGACGSASSRKKAKNSSMLAARPRTTPSDPAPTRARRRARAESRIGVGEAVATPEIATLTSSTTPSVEQGEEVAQLADDEVGLLLLRLLEDRDRGRRACRRASPGRSRGRPAMPTPDDARRGVLERSRAELPSAVADDARAARR